MFSEFKRLNQKANKIIGDIFAIAIMLVIIYFVLKNTIGYEEEFLMFVQYSLIAVGIYFAYKVIMGIYKFFAGIFGFISNPKGTIDKITSDEEVAKRKQQKQARKAEYKAMEEKEKQEKQRHEENELKASEKRLRQAEQKKERQREKNRVRKIDGCKIDLDLKDNKFKSCPTCGNKKFNERILCCKNCESFYCDKCETKNNSVGTTCPHCNTNTMYDNLEIGKIK